METVVTVINIVLFAEKLLFTSASDGRQRMLPGFIVSMFCLREVTSLVKEVGCVYLSAAGPRKWFEQRGVHEA